MADRQIAGLTARSTPAVTDVFPTQVSTGATEAGKTTLSELKIALASGNMFRVLYAHGALPPGTLYATVDIRVGGSTPAESLAVLDFDDTTAEYADWLVRLPGTYAGGGLTFSIEWSATSATTGAVVWGAAIRRIENDAEDIDASHTYDYNNASASTTASASGETVKATITFTSGADMDSWAAGETAIVRIRRLPTDGGDTLVGDGEFWNCSIKET